MGHNLREKGPESGFLHSATESLATGLESGGEYLQEKGISGMAGDVTDLIRRNPIPALLLAAGIGFLIVCTGVPVYFFWRRTARPESVLAQVSAERSGSEHVERG